MRIKREVLPAPSGALQVPIGKGRFVLMDQDAYPLIKNFRLKLRKSHSTVYVKLIYLNSHPRKEAMLHRLINNTPPDQQCHHRNGNTLDNRRSNLLNLSPRTHHLLEAFKRITQKK